MDDPTEVFRKDLGEWEVELEVTPPGMPANRSRGRATNRRVGTCLVTEYRTDQGFEGHGIYGWDPVQEKYVGTWVDSMSGTPARSVGTWDAATSTMTFEVETVSHGRTVRYRELTTTLPDGSLEYRNLVRMPDGTEHQMIHSLYRKVG